MTLFLHEIKRNRISLIVWSVALSFMLGVCIIIYPEMQTQMGDIGDMFSDMGAFSDAFGMDMLNFGEFMGYFGVEIGNTLGLGGAFLAALVGISALSKEERDHTAELLLTMPLTRERIVLEKLLFCAFHIAVVNLTVVFVSVIGIAAIGVDAEWGKIALIFLANFFMQLEIMMITFGISAFLKKNAIGIGIGLSFGLYFLNILSNLEESIEFVGKITPFGYANSGYIIENASIELVPLLIGMAFSACGVALAFYKYTKKDIA